MKFRILSTILLVCAAAVAQAQTGLRVTLSSDSAQLAGTDDVSVTVHVTNVSNETIAVPKRNLPASRSTAGVFAITRDGQPVAYTGLLVKRGPLTAADYVSIAAGATLDFKVELSALYDLSASGVYTVQYDAPGVPALRGRPDRGTRAATSATIASQAEPLDLASNAIALTITADAAADSRRATGDLMSAAGGNLATPQFAATVSFVGCSNTQQSQIRTALTSAEGYASNSKSYLNAGTRGARYTTWFGTYTANRYNTVKSHNTAIGDALGTKPMQFDCSTCPKDPELRDAYAYVYPNQPYRVYLCNSFWAAPNAGTDSRAGTIIHETSHFDVVAGTDDNAYGQTACKSLARRSPARAVANADSHEYFAENTPAQN